jgi:hypothetical protein
MNTRKIVWFSRHEITASQIREARKIVRNEDAEINWMKVEGETSIEDDVTATAVTAEILDKAERLGGGYVFGVFPPPILNRIAHIVGMAIDRGDHRKDCVAFYTPWNVARTPEGGKPTFEHKCFLWIGTA